MVHILIGLLFLLNASAAYSPSPPTIIACGNKVDIPNGKQVSDIIYLACYAASGPHYCTMRKPNGTSGYAVAGTTLHIFAACGLPSSTSSYTAVDIGYGDNDVGMDSSGAPTNPVWSFGYVTAATFSPGILASGKPSLIQTDFQIANGKYPQATAQTGSAWIFAWGYED